MEILILLRNILVPVAIGMWVIIGFVAFLVFLRNKVGCKIKPSCNGAYKQTYVHGCNPSQKSESIQDTNKAAQDALNATKALNDKEINKNSNKTNLCL